MDPGVRRSFQEMGQLLANGVSSIEFIVPGQRGKKDKSRIVAKFDYEAWERINERKDTSTKPVTLDGRLEAADFLMEDLTCVIHTSDNQRITCSFPAEKEEDVYKALRHVARVTGIARVNLNTRRSEHIDLSDVKVLNPFLGEQDDFFAPHTIQQLTQAQGINPAFDLRTLENAWPADEDVESFLEAIGELLIERRPAGH